MDKLPRLPPSKRGVDRHGQSKANPIRGRDQWMLQRILSCTTSASKTYMVPTVQPNHRSGRWKCGLSPHKPFRDSAGLDSLAPGFPSELSCRVVTRYATHAASHQHVKHTRFFGAHHALSMDPSAQRWLRALASEVWSPLSVPICRPLSRSSFRDWGGSTGCIRHVELIAPTQFSRLLRVDSHGKMRAATRFSLCEPGVRWRAGKRREAPTESLMQWSVCWIVCVAFEPDCR